VFEDAINIGGSFSPSDFEAFRFNSIAAFRPSVKALEDVHLVTSVRDETDSRRKSIVITPKAFLVYHYRSNQGKAGQSVQ
jgi:DNA-binding MarR family transcriptional regulator